MDADEMKSRTKSFSIACADLTIRLAKNEINSIYSRQLIRSSSSVAANYRAAIRAKSDADFINKLKIVEEELDESMFWIELLASFNADKRREFIWPYRESDELLRIIVSSIISKKGNSGRKS